MKILLRQHFKGKISLFVNCQIHVRWKFKPFGSYFIPLHTKSKKVYAHKTLLLPTQLEKKHSANGFNLLEVMQTPDLEVSARTKSITTIPNWGVNLTLTYSLSYGKKSERGDVDAEKQLNSAVMKTY